MKKIIRLTESDLARIVKRIINEQEDTSIDDYIKWDIKTTDCEGSRFGFLSSMGVVEDEDGNPLVRIRYCKGQHEELEYLKEKARMEIKMSNKLPDEDLM